MWSRLDFGLRVEQPCGFLALSGGGRKRRQMMGWPAPDFEGALLALYARQTRSDLFGKLRLESRVVRLVSQRASSVTGPAVPLRNT
jgi:hypothetical protein